MVRLDSQTFELTIRLSRDSIPTREVDVIYPFAQAHRNEERVLGETAALAARYPSAEVAVEDLEIPGGVYSGGKAWTVTLVKKGVDATRIVGVEQDRTKFGFYCSDTEAYSLLKLIPERRRWQRLLIIAPPYQITRVGISMISMANKLGLDLNLYFRASETGSWVTEGRNSDVGGTSRSWAIELNFELEKMAKYREKGDHLDPQEIIAYLNGREKRDLGIA